MKIGQYIQQLSGYQAFIPHKFPPTEKIVLENRTQFLLDRANLMIGKLDGITQLLPDLNFFILMYITKEATKSNEIEGTQASMSDVIKNQAELADDNSGDVLRIIKYIDAMNYGLDRLKSLPLSLRFIKEIHGALLTGTLDAHGKTTGEFRRSQNWIAGGSINSARFVPPPINEMMRALDDLEKFLHHDETYSPLIKAALIHAQFETIHPFLDGNGRTGRLLTTFYLCQTKLLEQPVLYLSDYFMNNKNAYYQALDDYHAEKGNITNWLDFFLDGIAIIATEAIQVSKKINEIRQNDLIKIQSFGSRAKNAATILENLYKMPIISIQKVMEWTNLSYPQADELTKLFVANKILQQKNPDKKRFKEFWYHEYLNLFVNT